VGNFRSAHLGIFLSAFTVIDAYARRIVGWRVSRSMEAGFVLEALDQALHARQPMRGAGLVHHSDRGVQGGLNRSSQQCRSGLI
jgi:transposase InsO family protein